jgi:hypothetical protein
VSASRLFSLLLLPAIAPLASATEIPLVKTGGVYAVPAEINDTTLKLDFIVDSGAAEVNIPADVVLTLIRAKAIVSSDFLPGRTLCVIRAPLSRDLVPPFAVIPQRWRRLRRNAIAGPLPRYVRPSCRRRRGQRRATASPFQAGLRGSQFGPSPSGSHQDLTPTRPGPTGADPSPPRCASSWCPPRLVALG